MRHLLLVVLVLMMAGCSGQPLVENLRAQLQPPSARYMAEGDRLVAEGRMAEALLAYRQAVIHDDRNITALYRLAQAYADQGRRRLALQYLTRAATLAPNDGEVARVLAELQAALPTAAPLKLLWQAETPDSLPTGFAVSAQTIYVAFTDGRLRALATATGARAWEVQLPASLTSAPEVGAGLVFVGAQDGVLRALEATTGRQRWEAVTSGPIYAAPTLGGNIVYCPSGDGTLYALDVADGRELWRVVATRPLTGRATVAAGMVYFGDAGGRIWAVDARTGEERWGPGVLAQGPVEGQPVVSDGRVFVGTDDSRLYALAVASGGEYWRFSTADAIYARPVVVGNTVYVASAGTTLTALDVLTGEERWEVRASSGLRYAPAVYRGIVYYAASGDPHLYAVDAASGRSLWQMDTGDWLAAEPIIAGETMYLLGKDGTVQAWALK